MSDNNDLHVSPSQAMQMANMSRVSTQKYILDMLTPSFQSSGFSFYLRTDVEEYIEKHKPILSLLEYKPRKGKDPEAVTDTDAAGVQSEG